MLGSISVTCRSKVAKIVLIGNPRWLPWPPSWKSIFRFSWTQRPIDSKFSRNIGVTYRSKIAKDGLSEIQDGRHGGHLENLFFASEPKGHLTPNLLGSIAETCRSKVAKIVPIENIGWAPWQPSWKSIFRFSWTERPLDSKLGRKHFGDL